MSGSPETQPADDTVDSIPQNISTLFATLSSLEFLLGVPLNFLVLSFFVLQSRKSKGRFIYICINAMDIIMCSSVLFQISDFFTKGHGILPLNLSVCTVHSVIWVVSAKLSVFLVMLLNVVRTIAMVCPLKSIPIKHLKVAVFTYLVLMLVQNSIPFWFGKQYQYWKTGNICVWTMDVFNGYLDQAVIEILRHLLHTFQFSFPSVVVIFCCTITVARLNRPVGIAHGFERKRRATITMLCITAAYLFFNIPFVTSTIIFTVEMTTGKPFLSQYMSPEQSYLLWNLMFHTHYINSTVNAAIYIVRVEGLREYVSGVFKKLSFRQALISRNRIR